jgi:transcriptional regulator with XRE-family HTH domain/tetratricopeptide (TPR) repeat protein
MAEKTPSEMGLALAFLRSKRGWSKKRLAEALGMADRSLLSRYERGDQLTRERLDVLLAPLGYPPEAVEVLRFADRLISFEGAASPGELTAAERGRIGEAAMAAGWTAGEWIYEALVHRKLVEKAEAARRDAEESWAWLKRATREDRRALVAVFPEFQSDALAARVCAASLRAAPHDAREALELAELALSVAERMAGEEDLRSRARGYCWAHVGNARRVGNDFDGADEAFARAWDLWRAGNAAGAELFPEWRLLSLEASLRRDQRRLPEALELLSRARVVCGAGEMAVARILLQTEHVLEVMGDTEGALAVLVQAAPLIEAAGDSDLLLRLYFNMADDLCQLGRPTQAAALLPRVRELAIEQANDLDLLRVVWLEAKIDAVQGRTAAAWAGLEQVRRKFSDLGMSYDAALASLDLAVLGLKAGHMAKVRELAVEIEAIFRAKKIHREALAALSLFWEAAKRETASVELVRQVVVEVEKAKRSAPRSERPR